MTSSPVRNVVTRSGIGIRGKFPSRKVGAMVKWESTLEADAIRLFEFNPGVAFYAAQPSFEIYHDADGSAHEFVPDFRVDWLLGGSMLVEVKSDEHADYRPTARILELKALSMQTQDKHYRVLRKSEIRAQPRFRNLQLLEQHARLKLAAESTAFLRRLDCRTAFLIKDLGQLIGGVQVVIAAIACGLLRTDLLQPLNEEGLVWHPDHKEAGDGSFQI